MGKLCVKLPPFSPDYSGVCSAIFELNCVAVLHDASGCTGNYTGYDEPRWYGSKAAIFCSGLREIDAILGDDEKLIQKVLKAAESLNPELIVLIGSPVPMVIGTDMVGIAADIESRTGIPCLGFDTTGTKYYSDGIAQTCISLMQRFTKTAERKIANGVNLLGVTPLDFSSNATNDLKALIKENGFELVCSFCDGLTMQAIENAAQASLNLVVSQSGLPPARYMEKRFGIPYLVQIPIGNKAKEDWLSAIRDSLREQTTVIPTATGGKADTLVLGDEILCRSLQLALEADYGITADCGCLFGIESELVGENILNLNDEQKIDAAINSRKYRRIIGDPMLRMLLQPETKVEYFDLPSYCISSKMSGMAPVSCIGEKFQSFFDSRAEHHTDQQ
ncbi:MAG: nitrogenase component 1 [Clostridium sp.]|uniref:nitrogenase component 1 n=1 Tax=Clostridium sp. TaxID=1506 RepID=UPI00290B8814|nr:nitrogenase component 1 [Clostridium sp.]MDU7336776.1 nitrogenase component 1 [Clostridium sp.]